MYSAASPRLMIHSARCGGRTPNAMFCAYTAQVAWLSPQMPQIRLVMKCASRGSLPFMNTLYPRKMDDVLLHSTTLRLAKSIFVWMPRLPTMRVTGSHDMSTNCGLCASLIVPLPLHPGVETPGYCTVAPSGPKSRARFALYLDPEGVT